MTDDTERPITEAEYRAWLEWKLPRIVGELSELLPQGLHFEWTSDSSATTDNRGSA